MAFRAWSVELDVVDMVPGPVTDVMTAQLLEEIGGPHGGVLSTHPDRPNWWGITIGVEAPTAQEAIAEAIRVVSRACRKIGLVNDLTIEGIEVSTFEELEAELARPAFPELLGVAELAELLGVSRQRASQITKTKAFPAPVARLASGPVWTAPSVSRFVDQWQRKPGRPAKTTEPMIAAEDDDVVIDLYPDDDEPKGALVEALEDSMRKRSKTR